MAQDISPDLFFPVAGRTLDDFFYGIVGFKVHFDLGSGVGIPDRDTQAYSSFFRRIPANAISTLYTFCLGNR